MQIDELIPPSSTSAYPVSQPDDPYVADLLQLADGRFVFFGDSKPYYRQNQQLLNGCVDSTVDACTSFLA